MSAAVAPDALGDSIVQQGFAPSMAVLDINGSLCVPRDFALPAPWNLPSRLFQFPIEVCGPENGQPRKLGLRHPGLVDHPWVKAVETSLGVSIDPNGAPNQYGYSCAAQAQYHHAVDLISEGHWRELMETIDFTTCSGLFCAIDYGLTYSGDDSGKGRGYLSTTEARSIMDYIGATEPESRTAALLKFMQPIPSSTESGSVRYPINGRLKGEDKVWALIYGIEDGWFEYDRSGFLQWSDYGRDRYAAGEEVTFTEASGQTAFAF